MIKKLLSTFLFATTTIIATAQCTADVSCVPSGKTYGICPDSTTGLKHGVVGVAYTETISIKVPTTGADFGVPAATVKDVQILSVEGLEPNLTYACTPSNCTFPGGTTGCALISGTPTQVWDKPIVVKAMAHATVPIIGAVDYPQTLTGYRCVVTGPTGIDQLGAAKFDVGQNAPNPVTGKSEIHFSVVNSENIDFKVYNMLGAVVYANNFKADKGMNTIIIEANSFAPGVYMYSVANASQTITKRMIVSR